MAGAAPMPSGKSARKALDAALNLVPFIDLLSCCIAFLLITAVWTEIGAVPVGHKGADRGPPDPSPPREQVAFTLYVDGDGYTLTRTPGEAQQIPRRGGDDDLARLREVLARAHDGAPEQHELTIRAADAVPYDRVVRAMDVALGARFEDLRVAGNEGT